MLNHNRSSAELKRLAKGQLLGKYSGFLAAEFIFFGIMFLLCLCIAIPDYSFSAFGTVLYYAIYFLVELLGCIFMTGLCYMYLRTIQNTPVSASDIFHGFRQHADRVIVIGAVITILQSLAEAPSMILLYFYRKDPQAPLFLAVCIAFLIGLTVSTYISLLFAPVYFIVLDFPDCGAAETLKLSIRFMKGHKGRYLYIILSFLPLHLLCMLTCGIGYLWLIPYMGMTDANFYMDLMESRKRTQES